MAMRPAGSGADPSSPLSPLRQHPLLLWLNLLDTDYDGHLLLLSLGAYYLLLAACGWFVLQRFRRGRPWAQARSLLVEVTSKLGVGAGAGGGGGGHAAKKKKTSKKAPALPPLLKYKESARNRRLLEKTTVLRQPYTPSPWLGHRLGGHMQSFMFATWCPPGDRGAVSRLVSREERVVSSFDGGVFRMDWFNLRGASLPADAPIVLVLPGVVGQGTNVYVRHLAAHLSIKYGWRAVAKSWRGIGSRLTTRRPETWDHVALSDARDAIRHVRATVGQSVPIMGVGFSFGGCLLTAVVGSMPQEEHGLCGLVSISGLFDMSSMMRHIAEQYPYPYGFANTKVTVNNYRKFKVLETLGAEDAATGTAQEDGDAGGGGGGGVESSATLLPCSPGGLECTFEGNRTGASAFTSSSSSGGRGSSEWSARRVFGDAGEEPSEPSATAVVTRAERTGSKRGYVANRSSSDGNSSTTSPGASPSSGRITAGCSRSVDSSPIFPVAAPTAMAVATSSSRRGRKTLRETPATIVAPACGSTDAAAAASLMASPASCRGADELDEASAASAPRREFQFASSLSPTPPGRRKGLVTARQMAAMKDPGTFHEALTLPFTGDRSVESYFERLEGIMSRDLSQVNIPTLCLLAKDDPLCPPLAWEGALKRAKESEGIVVAITDHGGHCGWFDGLGAGSWLDRAAGDFLASALELSKEATARDGHVPEAGQGGGVSGAGISDSSPAVAVAAVSVGADG